MSNNTVTLTGEEWAIVRAALTYTAIKDRQDGREELAEETRRVREAIADQNFGKKE